MARKCRAYALPDEVEEWQDVLDYEGLYKASTWGRIRSMDRFISSQNRWSTGRVLRAAPNGRTNYCSVVLSDRNSKQKTWLVHDLVARSFHGERPSPAHVIHHIDGNRNNNRPDNLEYRLLSEHAAESGAVRGGESPVEYVEETLPILDWIEKHLD